MVFCCFFTRFSVTHSFFSLYHTHTHNLNTRWIRVLQCNFAKAKHVCFKAFTKQLLFVLSTLVLKYPRMVFILYLSGLLSPHAIQYTYGNCVHCILFLNIVICDYAFCIFSSLERIFLMSRRWIFREIFNSF